MEPQKKLAANQNGWNKRFHRFVGWCALPTWGPFEVGKDDPSLVGEIQGKTFLEICCGSGHSAKYLLDNGAAKVYVLDLSEKQLELTGELNKEYVEKGILKLFHGPMESVVTLPEKVDVVFSVYGIGWTVDPQKTFSHIFSYMKPGGRFVWSWDHTLFTDAKIVDGKVVVEHSYQDESEIIFDNEEEGPVYVTYRKTSSWFAYLKEAGFVIDRYLEPAPLNLDEDIEGIAGPGLGNYYSKEKANKLPVVIIFDCKKPLSNFDA